MVQTRRSRAAEPLQLATSNTEANVSPKETKQNGSSATMKDWLAQFKHASDTTTTTTNAATNTTTNSPTNTTTGTSAINEAPPRSLSTGASPLHLTRKRSSTTFETQSTLPFPPSHSPSPSPAKKRRQSSKYASPAKYAHLPELVDVLEPNLIAVFVGTNPGIRTATAGHAYAHPSNHFWRLLHSSGCTDARLRPEEDRTLPRRYGLGNTNIVARPSKDAAELSKAEMAAGAGVLDEKFRRFRPAAVCIVGKGIWEAIWRWRHGREIRKEEFRYGWQDDAERMGRAKGWEGARVFVATSTSGLSASTTPQEKEAIWRPFGEWVRQQRRERAAAEGVKPDG